MKHPVSWKLRRVEDLKQSEWSPPNTLGAQSVWDFSLPTDVSFCSVPLSLTPLSFPNLALSAKPLDMPWTMRILIKNTQIKTAVEQGWMSPALSLRHLASEGLSSKNPVILVLRLGQPFTLWLAFPSLNDYGLWLIPLFPLILSKSPQHPSLGWWGDKVWLSLPQTPSPSWGDSVASNWTQLRG